MIKYENLQKVNEKLFDKYNESFDNFGDEFIKLIVSEDYFDIYHIFNIRHKKRDELKKYLFKNKINTEVHYPIAPHKQEVMKGIISGNYPISQEIHDTTLSLPISYFHTQKDIIDICKIINRWGGR